MGKTAERSEFALDRQTQPKALSIPRSFAPWTEGARADRPPLEVPRHLTCGGPDFVSRLARREGPLSERQNRGNVVSRKRPAAASAMI